MHINIAHTVRICIMSFYYVDVPGICIHDVNAIRKSLGSKLSAFMLRCYGAIGKILPEFNQNAIEAHGHAQLSHLLLSIWNAPTDDANEPSHRQP